MVVGVVGTALTSLKQSVLGFFLINAEIAYVILFPQLVAVLFFNISNGYGAVIGLLVGLVIKLLSGNPALGLKPVIHFPGGTLEDGVDVMYVPVMTVSMLSAFAAILLFSYLFSVLFNKGLLPEKWDVSGVKDKCAPTALSPTDGAMDENEKLSQAEVSQPMMSTSC